MLSLLEQVMYTEDTAVDVMMMIFSFKTDRREPRKSRTDGDDGLSRTEGPPVTRTNGLWERRREGGEVARDGHIINQT